MGKNVIVNDYMTVIKNGLNIYGLNGFYEMHSDICKGITAPWENNFKILNNLSYKEFVRIVEDYIYNKGRC